MKEITRALFSGEGKILLQLPMIALISFVMGEIATLFGKGNITRYIHVAGALVAVYLIVGMAGRVLEATFGLMGF